MIDSFKTSSYKTGVPTALPQWDITFTVADFQNMTGYATIQGPISLVIDIDASGTAYPTYYGVEIQTVDRAVNVTDAPQIAFIPRNERKVITPGSVPQLAYIQGEITKIIVHCFGFATFDAANCRISLRVGPAAPLTAPQSPVGRSTMIYEPGVFFSSGGLGNLICPANTTSNSLFSLNISVLTGIRFRFKSIQLFLPATPSYAGDIEAHLQVIDRVATLNTIARVSSLSTGTRDWVYPFELILDVGFTLRCFIDNYNLGVNYSVGYNVLYEEIY